MKVVDRSWVVTVGVGFSRVTPWLTPEGDCVDIIVIHKVAASVWVLADSIQCHMVTPTSHSIGVSIWTGERFWLTY